MVLCKFFQQGLCRYGESCRFEHPRGRFDDTSVVSPLLRASQQQHASPQNVHHNTQHNVFGSRQQSQPQNVFASRPQQQNVFGARSSSTPADLREIYSILVQELDSLEKSGQWPLSCLNPAPLRVHGNIPGLEDHSPDELRCLLYEARVVGGLDSCKQQIQMLYQQAQAGRNALRNANAETFSILEAFLSAPSSNAQQFSFSLPGGVVHDSWPAANSSSQSSAFTRPSASGGGPSIFGGSGQGQPLAFGASMSTSIFGGASEPTSSTSVFGGSSPNQPPVFGNSSVAPFGSTVPSNTSIFAGSSAQSSFNVPGQTNVYSSPSAAASSFTFKLPNSSATGPSTENSPFGAQSVPSQNVFGASGSEQERNLISGFQPIANAQPVFNANGNSILNTSLGVTTTSLHTELSALMEEEKKEFTAATFTVGHIPVRPPPKELCN